MSAQPPRRAPDDAVPSRAGSSFVRRLATRAKAGSPSESRRGLFKGLAALGLSLSTLTAQKLSPPPSRPRDSDPSSQDQDQDDPRLPNGKSQKDAIAQAEHEKALKDAEALVSLCKELKDDLQKAGNFVVPVSALRKTQEIEKLARSVRSHLQS
jgi:hypothetical protein